MISTLPPIANIYVMCGSNVLEWVTLGEGDQCSEGESGVEGRRPVVTGVTIAAGTSRGNLRQSQHPAKYLSGNQNQANWVQGRGQGPGGRV